MLNISVATTNIIDYYITLRTIHPTNHPLLTTIETYLKTRVDTVRTVITMLTAGRSDEVFGERKEVKGYVDEDEVGFDVGVKGGREGEGEER